MRNKWDQLYGDFDCEANSVAYWMNTKGISPRSLVSYNWDFYFDENEVLFRGCIPVPQLIEFLRHAYELTVTELTFDQLPYDELMIIPANAYWLPYAPDYYMTQRLVHYYPARRLQDGGFIVWDSIFNNMGGGVDEAILRRAFEDAGRTVLFLCENKIPERGGLTVPFMAASDDYKACYSRTVEKVLSEIHSLLDHRGNLMKDMNFKRYFGNIQSILLARERYVQTVRPPSGEVIVNLWRNVIKQLVRLSYIRHQGWDSFAAALLRVAQEEVSYLSQFNGGRKLQNGGKRMSQDRLQEEIITLLEKVLNAPTEDIRTDLEGSGMNSMVAIQLIVELEMMYDIEFEDSELLYENFNTVENIVVKLQEKLSHKVV